ncbi:MAG TPA: Asp-tRNA(Asn)/Glu-tRNA(Gln) amidotransferase subunit GatA [Solirubrobacteraceae bacterium]|nr:Asp-tRNA(Asn)/Glu-tRNA(Gln) amidotransferase subunit GatA [Solirubrobacteraceae bacterium]
MSTDMLELSAGAAIAEIEAGNLSARELFAFYRRRATEHGGDIDAGGLNCFTWVAEDVPEAGEGPLAGVPLAVKDLFCTEGVPSQSGSRILQGYRPPYTATSVQRLQTAGATLLAKANQDEFAMGSSNESSAFGPVLNPWDRGRVPGGSSGGSAAAVAAGLAPWALGTDTGGSIRQPAALCGIVGLKPTYGSVSRYGMIAFASSLDQAGPLTRNVTDAALLLEQMIGRDPCDATSLEFPQEIARPRAERLDGVRLGVPAELQNPGADFAGAELQPGVRAAFERALELAQELGASVQEVHLPHAAHALSAYYILASSEASSNLARFDGVRYGMRAADATDLLDMYTRTRHDGFGAEVKRRIMLGTYALSAGYYDAFYGRAQRVRTLIAQDFTAAFADVDLIVTPTSANVAFALGEKTTDPWSMYVSDFFTVPMSLAGIPAISIPCGLAAADGGAHEDETRTQAGGLPVGLQIAGPAFSENRLLDAAHALEQAIGFAEGSARV